ncbi:MAG: TetR/AcrR family transcriptional regulator [Candidatus Eisenbacteria bacterium]|nr:TetR/AcrR family transcriptional regulator [Candidatus Eisenbacteria bacterium]
MAGFGSEAMEIPAERSSGDSGGGGEEARLPRKEREKEMHRRDVFAAAERLLGKKSFGEITVQEIAAEAEFSVGYLYKLFPGKEEIYGDLILGKMEEIGDLVRRRLEGEGTEREKVSGFIHDMFGFLAENPTIAMSYVREMMVLTMNHKVYGPRMRKQDEKMFGDMNRIFEQAIRKGILCDEDPQWVTRTFGALLWGFIHEDIYHDRVEKDWSAYPAFVEKYFFRAFAPDKDDDK